MLFYNQMEEPVLRRPVEPRQYMGRDFRALCLRQKISQSVGCIGSSQDNAVAESFWATLKCELVSRYRFATRAEARRAIIAWIKRYNALHLHSTLGNVLPLEWELRYAQRDLLAALPCVRLTGERPVGCGSRT